MNGPEYVLTIANHWSYIGIGWNMGIESCVDSLNDSMAVTDAQWGLKTCINLDAAAYELIDQNFPEVIDKLKKYIKEGKVEIIGGTYSQALGSMIGNESNIRQLTFGREVIKRCLGEDISTFLEEEEYSHPQLPQLLKSAGYRYSSLAQCDTWGSSGIPHLELGSFYWKAKDGTILPCIPKNSLFRHPPSVTPDIGYFETAEGRQKIKELKKTGIPMAVVWTEFGWEPLGEKNINGFDPEMHRQFKERNNVRYATIKEYFEKYGSPEKELGYVMDDFDKILPWGIGGDQIRVNDRKAEALLITAEQLDAFASVFDRHSVSDDIESVWKDMLAAQSHDVTLCEYSRWQCAAFIARNRIYDTHQIPWGALGYFHLDKALLSGEKIVDKAMGTIAANIGSISDAKGDKVIVVYNPCPWERKNVLASTGKIYLKDAEVKDLCVIDASGQKLPSQTTAVSKDAGMNIETIEMIFDAGELSSAGYSTYYIKYGNKTDDGYISDLKTDKQKMEIENKYIKIRIDRQNGNIVSLFDKKTGKELLDPGLGFAEFCGSPNKRFCENNRIKNVPEYFNNAASQTQITWMEEGPLKATVKVLHAFPDIIPTYSRQFFIGFEMLITVCCDSPKVDIVCRLNAAIPPAVDKNEINGWQFENRIDNGYWLDIAPGFVPEHIYRDIPFAVEEAKKDTFHGFSFIDMVGKDRAMLLVHSGTQYFKKKEGNIISNLLMREWESALTNNYGWQPYNEYKYSLIPHAIDITNQERLRYSMEMDHKVIVKVSDPAYGTQPKHMNLFKAEGKGFCVTAFRRKKKDTFEIRMYETEGSFAEAYVEMLPDIDEVYETDLEGKRLHMTDNTDRSFKAVLKPWQIATYEIKVKYASSSCSC
jgi:hypothetical protein